MPITRLLTSGLPWFCNLPWWSWILIVVGVVFIIQALWAKDS